MIQQYVSFSLVVVVVARHGCQNAHTFICYKWWIINRFGSFNAKTLAACAMEKQHPYMYMMCISQLSYTHVEFALDWLLVVNTIGRADTTFPITRRCVDADRQPSHQRGSLLLVSAESIAASSVDLSHRWDGGAVVCKEHQYILNNPIVFNVAARIYTRCFMVALSESLL